MKLKPSALIPKVSKIEAYEEDSSDYELIKPRRRPKRIVEDDSSSSDDNSDNNSDEEDNIPLSQRKTVRGTNKKTTHPTKKARIIEGDLAISEKITEIDSALEDHVVLTKFKTPVTISKDTSLSMEEPIVLIKQKSKKNKTQSRIQQETEAEKTQKMPPPSFGFKIPAPQSPTNEFKAPFAPPLSDMKAPSGEFKVPFAPPSNDFKTSMSEFINNQPTDLTSSRLSHYMTCICQDLDKYEQDKTKQTDSLLTFRDDDDIPTLDITVMRKFTSLAQTIIKQSRNLDTVNMTEFGRVVKLMENTIIVSTDMDIIDYYGKNPENNKESTLNKLQLCSDALEACTMIFDLLTACKLDRKFLSRNLVTNCLHFVKNQLDYTIYPLIDLADLEDGSMTIITDAHRFMSLVSSSPKEKRLFSAFIPHIIRFFKRAFTLILSEELDDDVLVIIAYISMAPFFHDCSGTHVSTLLALDVDDKSFSPYEQLKFYTLDILKHVFSKYPRHRRWIFEEILTSLGSLSMMDGQRRYRLRDNRSIHVISALFMQLVQCSSSLNDLTSHKSWFQMWNIKYQKACKNKEAGKETETIKMLDDKLNRRATAAWRQSAEAAANSASFFLEFLMSKCKSKKMDAFAIAEYRLILEQTLQDIITVFNDPEWPVAEMIMKVFSRILISLLQENNSSQYLKSLAIEWLGIIACKIKTGYNKLSGGHKTYTPEWVCDLNETLPIQTNIDTPISAIAQLDQCRKKLLDYIKDERVSDTAVQFYLCNWGFIESVVWTKANKGWEVKEKKPGHRATDKNDATMTDNHAEDEKEKEKVENKEVVEEEDITMMDSEPVSKDILIGSEDEDEMKWPKETALLLGNTCKYYWLSCIGVDQKFPTLESSFSFPEMAHSDHALLAELLASRQTLYTSYNFILSEILTCLEKDAVIYRAKALKALGKIAFEVPEIMEEKRILNAVVQRVHDGSPSVRDAAVDVVAKYLSRLSTVPKHLYDIVSNRIMDTAVAVRKRLVKLLRDLYLKFSDPEIKIDIASKLIMRISDNEVTISSLSLKSTQEILFQPFKEIEQDGNDYFGYSYANSPKDRKRKITDLTRIITGAVAKLDPSLSAQNAALSQIIKKTAESTDETLAIWYDKVFQWIVDSLFDRMMMLDEQDNSTEFINCLATVYSFTESYPNLLRQSHISMLHPYLSVYTTEDWTKAKYVLAIYSDVLPRMKNHAPEFVQSVEQVLMQLLSKCPSDLISYGVSCLCVIVDGISHRYNILIKMLGSCITKLRQVRQHIIEGDTDSSFKGVLKMLMICGLLCQHFEFDKKRDQDPEAMASLDLVYKGNIGILVFDLLQFFTSDIMDELKSDGMAMRMTALQGLGYFYSSYPTFMISPNSTTLMDKIFEQGSIELKAQLMRVFQEFLGAEEKRIGKREKAYGEQIHTNTLDMNTLLGNTEEYAELGVNGSLMQRYLKKILKCALSESEELRYAGFEVVSAIVHQGLAHPVLCMPAVVAAETSPDLVLRNKAYYLHKYAHDKYGGLLYIQLSEYLLTSFNYQKILLGEKNVKGYGKRGGDARVDPLLGLTFNVLKEKKKAKLDFLSSLVKPFKFDLKTTNTEDVNVAYLKYLAENMITLEFCTTEEVLTIVYIVDRILMTLGTDLLSYVHFLKKQNVIVTITDDTEGEEEEEEELKEETDHDLIVASKLALAMCMVLYVKNLLVELYDIPDDEIREFNPNSKKRSRDVTKDSEVSGLIDWSELLYFKKSKLDTRTASDACIRFEYLIMNDTTAVVEEQSESDD